MIQRRTWPFGATPLRILIVALLSGLFALVPAPTVRGAEITWIRQFGSANGDNAYAVAADGNVYVAGLTAGALPGQTVAGTNDAFVRKYDADGNELWTRQFGTSSPDDTSGIAVDASGVYVVGYTSGALPGQSSLGGGDAFIRKYDPDGNELWTRQFGTASTDDVSGVVADSSGVYVAGHTSGILPGQTRVGYWDAFLRKYDASGNEVWTRQFGTIQLEEVHAVSADASGIYVAGYTMGVFAGYTSGGGRDAFLVKYDVNGNALWARQTGGIWSDEAFGVAATAGGIYLVVNSRGNLYPEIAVQKYDANGVRLWTKQFGTNLSADASGIAADDSGVYVVGQISGTLPDQIRVGGRDAFVRKYDADGNQVWTQQFGTTSDDDANGVSVAPTGIFVVGRTFGTFPGQPAVRSADAYLAKFAN
jgi:hypothetical protein